MAEEAPPPIPPARRPRRFSTGWLVAAAALAALATLAIAALLTNIFERQREAEQPFYGSST